MSIPEQESEHWETIYQEVRKSFDFLVANVRSQQDRIATVLVANCLIFGFLGANGGVFVAQPYPWSSGLYISSMSFLALGLLCALTALFPLI